MISSYLFLLFKPSINLLQCSGHPSTRAYPPTPSRIFPVPHGREAQTRREILKNGLKIEVKFPLSANRKSYMPRRLAQQRMASSNLEWLFLHRAISLQLLSILFTVVRES